GADGAVTTRRRVPALALTTVVMFTVSLVTGLGSLALEPWQATLDEFSGAMAGWVIASATLGTAVRFFMQTYAQSLSVHSHGVVILVLEPMWTALFAALWFGETMTAVQVSGCLMIFLSLLVNRWSSVRRALKTWLA
ncbi:EamA family transporter, partial [Alloalcanivorax gelatiniphagus]